MSFGENSNHNAAQEVHLPAPTVWPLILAFGFTLLFAGMLTSVSVTLLGAALSLAGCVGWFKDVFPHQREMAVRREPEDIAIGTSRNVVERFPLVEEQLRAWLPLETYPISAGLKGGLAGAVAMAFFACVYGFLSVGSLWYPINLLAASVYSQSQLLSPSQLNSFHSISFLIAAVLHLVGSTLVGLLYGAMLPMLARRPIVLGGLIAPLIWSGLLYTILGLVNPLLASRIHWGWFVASQIAFGVVAGLVVLRQSRVITRENAPFAIRAGIEVPGAISRKDRGSKAT